MVCHSLFDTDVYKRQIYDNAKYTKKGWINRNRILQNNKDTLISISVEKDSDYLDIKDRSRCV